MSKPEKKTELSNKDHHLSLQLMHAYLEETLPEKQMHQVERHLLDCALCADAMEGLSFINNPSQADESVNYLKRKIRKRSLREPVLKRKKKKTPLLWRHMSVAAATIVLVVGSILVFRLNAPKKAAAPISLGKEQIQVTEPALPAAGQAAPVYSDALPPAENNSTVSKKAAAKPTPGQSLQETDKEAKTRSTAGLPPEVAIDQIEEQLKDEEILASQEQKSLQQAPPVVAEARREQASRAPLVNRSLQLPSEAVGITQNFITVSGKVTAASDTTVFLPGVKVAIKGTNKSAITDYRGRFSMAVPPGSTLVFSMEGRTDAEVTVADRKPITVLMKLEGEEETTEELAEEIIEEDNLSYKPQPENGLMNYRSYLKKNLRYPAEARKNNIQGNVRVEFTVKPDGQLADFTVKKGLGYGCDEEALRLIKEGPAWKPAIYNGKKTERKITVYVPFKL
jgi:TonB family protein